MNLELVSSQGYAIIENVISPDKLALFQQAVELSDRGQVRERNRSAYAVRNLLRVPEIAKLANSKPLRGIVEPLLGETAQVVRGILFDKTPGANWKVAWHQDLSIAVKERIDLPGFGPWSVKAGVVHVQPPREILESMITLRLHLDDCFEDNGPLNVLRGSHLHGVLSPAQIEQWRREVPATACLASAGSVLVMRPLILHASSPASSPNHRRVIHLEYAAGGLVEGMSWQAG